MTTTAVEPIFLDTNVLVYSTVFTAPLHAVAAQTVYRLRGLSTPLWISRQVLREYLATLSRPQTFTSPIPLATLVTTIQLFEQQFHMADEGARVTAALLNLLNIVPVGGRQIHDANLVATMQVYGIRNLLTHNAGDFTRFSQFINVIPL